MTYMTESKVQYRQYTRDNLLEIIDYLNLKHKEYTNSNYIQICNPFVNDKKFHLGLNYKTQTYNCFKTGEKGKLSFLLSKLLSHFNLKLSDIKLTHEIKTKNIDELFKKPQQEQLEQTQQKIELLQGSRAVELQSESLANNLFLKYLLQRNITKELIEKYKLYYNVNQRRIVIPYFSCDNEVIFWVARDITNKAQQKYLYPPNAHKSHFIYNLQNNLSKEQLIIVEGQFNAMILDAVAVGGSSLSAEQVKQISKLKPKKITVAFDQDSAGINGMLDACKKLSQYFKDVNYFVLPNRTKEDFCDWGIEKSKELLNNNLKKYSYMSELLERAKFL